MNSGNDKFLTNISKVHILPVMVNKNKHIYGGFFHEQESSYC